MAQEKLVIPPIRTCLEDLESRKAGNRNDPPALTDKSWYFYWRKTSDTVNGLVTSGTHADRPSPASVPDGAFYTETDRGDVIYQNIDGNWQYIAGTMWGTLNPDQRPTDLGPNDAGFEFRSVDADPVYGGRDFLWSQSEWIEITPIRYGTHAQRLALAATSLWSGSLFIETDRSHVIYQNQNGTWQYLAGTMWGTVTPDQRPTDLGVHDGGFHFHGTDDNREFMWSQTVWIEVTAVRYGIHSARPAPANVADGSVYVESDRHGVIYQQQAGAWKYLAGTMYGTLSPDQRPTDLGVNDGGFEFRGTDQQRHFIWSQTAWVEDTPATPVAGDVQMASASANLTLSTVVTPIPGTTLNLNRAGRYLITAHFTFVLVGADTGQGLRGKLFAGGADQGGLALVTAFNAGTYAATTQQWIYTAPSAGQQAYLSASKDGGTGTSQVQSSATTITALWVSA